MPTYKIKTLRILLLSALPVGDKWCEFYAKLCEEYSQKAVEIKMNEMVKREYLAYGCGNSHKVLTEKGHTVLMANLAQLDTDEVTEVLAVKIYSQHKEDK